jgi:nucleoside-diphosphate-sugar epimerase
MKILVTGGTGFTGSALVRRLLQMGHDVRVLDNQEGIMLPELKALDAEVILGSVTDQPLVEATTQGCEFVFHVAAAFRQLNVPDQHYYDVNVLGTRHVMAAARQYGVEKVVYCSTQGVHGHIANPPGNEDSPIAPADYYQQTKYEGEQVVQEFIRQGMRATILRPTAIYGPGDPERFHMIYRRLAKGPFPMFGRGDTYYHPLYIDNLVDAFICSMDKGDGGTYIIGDEAYFPIRVLVEKVARAMKQEPRIRYFPVMPLVVAGHVCEKVCQPFGITPPIFPRRVDWYRQVRAFKIDKAKSELGYIPKIDIDEGLKRTGEWYVQKGYLPVAP